jgi:hypothetical protein
MTGMWGESKGGGVTAAAQLLAPRAYHLHHHVGLQAQAHDKGLAGQSRR